LAEQLRSATKERACRIGGGDLGYLIAAGLVTLGLIPKAVLEAGYFQDRKSAKKTLCIWALSVGSNALAFGIAFLIDYLG